MIKSADYPAKWRCVLLGSPNSGGAGIGGGAVRRVSGSLRGSLKVQG